MIPSSVELFLDMAGYLSYLAEGIKNQQAFSEGDKEKLSNATVYISNAIDAIEGKSPLGNEG